VDDAHRLLRARSLIKRSGEVTAAALLIFGREPQAFFPEAYVRVLRYAGRDRGTGKNQRLTHDSKIEGDIPSLLMAAREEIKDLQPSRRALAHQGRFESVPLIPEDAWLEGLVNAVVHRSYSLGGDHIRVEIFDDRIEVESPGRFPGLISLKDPLNTTRFARNPRIARVCSDLSFGQELGEGIRRIFEEMRAAGLTDPAYRETSASVRLILLSLALDRQVLADLPSGSQELLVILRREGPLGTGELLDLAGRSRPYVLKRLDALAAAGLVLRIGKSKNDPRAMWTAEV
jgi:ATP-dependent DNA helicase RecG